MKKIFILIPAFKPDSSIMDTILKLTRLDVEIPIVVVNDGSGIEYAQIFLSISNLEGVEVVNHTVNLGKGAALKTGLNYILSKYPSCAGVVTADADGQHAPSDILAVAKSLEINSTCLILGCRKFDGDVPFRSKLGNTASRYLYNAFLRINVTDTQTGLRGLPIQLANQTLGITSNRYELETDQLIIASRSNTEIKEIEIETIYNNDNESSHFNPIIDSCRIYFTVLRHAVSSLLVAAIDFLIYAIVIFLGGGVITGNLLSRSVALFVQYNLSKKLVFKVSGGWKRFTCYVCYVYAAAYVSGLLQIQASLLPGLNEFTSKLLVESLMFIFTFLFLRSIIFRRDSIEVKY